ncbi:MAG TPA: thermonuclease family protein [Patescibacteria group bacterium]|nr:thermonuclease family protein [Patescibacteria group bacterium]
MLNKKFFIFGLVLIFVGVIILSNRYRSNIQVISPLPSFLPFSPNFTYAKVTRVIDGDTIEIEDGQKVRYIGVDTSEIYPKIECYSEEAKKENENLVLGRTVKLEKDVSETDKYSRLLRYVYLDNEFINDELVKTGFAKVETVPPDIKYKSEFLESENYAKENKLGLWSKCF